MSVYSGLNDIMITLRSFFYWQDTVEILFVSAIIYNFSLWLKRDRYKNLLGYFYLYCVIGFGAYIAHLSVITLFMCLFSPVILMLFILMHQHTLQKNFVALHNPLPLSRENNDNWLEIIIRSCLVTINKNASITYVIEHTESLKNFLHAAVPMQTPINTEVLTIIMESKSFNQDQLLWINSEGMIQGFNAYWLHGIDEQLIASETSPLEVWKQNALFFTAKNDAIVLHINPTSRTFDLVIKGSFFHSISANTVVPFIKKYLNTSKKQHSKGDFINAAHIKKKPMHKHTT